MPNEPQWLSDKEIESISPISLQTVLNEIAYLKAEYARAMTVISALRSDKQLLIEKTEALHSELRAMHNNSIEGVTSTLALLTTEVNELRGCIHACDCHVKKAKRAKIKTKHQSNSPTPAVNANAISPSHGTSVLNDTNTYAAAAVLREAKIAAEPLRGSSATVSVLTPTSAPTASLSYAAAAAANINISTPPTLSASSTNADAAHINMSTVGANQSTVRVLSEQMHTQTSWTTIQGRSRKNNKRSRDVVIGLNSSTELDVVATNKWLYLASFKPSVTEDNIISYVAKNANIDKNQILCFKLIKKDTDIQRLKKN